ncbi:helix-turn-helix transcriptional regulator [Lachnospiraceae bacterium 48-42]|jgi:Predicted transcriptional regulators|nr:helix-turn-helix transcriptional regulator [Dorea sp.]
MNTNNNFNIGERIYELRKANGFSQEQLALKSEITPTYLGLLERNLKSPTLRVLGQVCDALNVTFSDFFSNTSPASYEALDSVSMQICAQISNHSESEKLMLLKILKDIISFQEQSGS